jgi:hypothetical protein
MNNRAEKKASTLGSISCRKYLISFQKCRFVPAKRYDSSVTTGFKLLHDVSYEFSPAVPFTSSTESKSLLVHSLHLRNSAVHLHLCHHSMPHTSTQTPELCRLTASAHHDKILLNTLIFSNDILFSGQTVSATPTSRMVYYGELATCHYKKVASQCFLQCVLGCKIYVFFP